MPRNMSFALTTEQILDKTKTVTRRFGWKFLKKGDILNAVEKSMGLKKGERIKKLALIRVVSIRTEPLNLITKEDCIKEGFPDNTPGQFMAFLIENSSEKIDTSTTVNRIEFEYIG